MELSFQYRERKSLNLGSTHRSHIRMIRVPLLTRDKQYSLPSIGRGGFECEDLVLFHPFFELAKVRSLTEYQIRRSHRHAEREQQSLHRVLGQHRQQSGWVVLADEFPVSHRHRQHIITKVALNS